MTMIDACRDCVFLFKAIVEVVNSACDDIDESFPILLSAPCVNDHTAARVDNDQPTRPQLDFTSLRDR
jgi:hypothetical protein